MSKITLHNGNRIAWPDFDDLEAVALRSQGTLERNVKSLRGVNGEGLTFDLFPSHDLQPYFKRLLQDVRPLPRGQLVDRAMDAFLFGAAVGLLANPAEDARLDTSTYDSFQDNSKRQVYVRFAGLRYLSQRQNLEQMVERNVLCNAPKRPLASQLKSIAGLAIMQCEEYMVDGLLKEQEAKIGHDIEAEFGLLKDEPKE